MANCFASYEVGSCQICDPGYQRNKEGICTQVTINQCEIGNLGNNYKKTNFVAKNLQTLHTSLYFFDQEYRTGCTKCSLETTLAVQGDVLVQINKGVDVTNIRDDVIGHRICMD